MAIKNIFLIQQVIIVAGELLLSDIIKYTHAEAINLSCFELKSAFTINFHIMCLSNGNSSVTVLLN